MFNSQISLNTKMSLSLLAEYDDVTRLTNILLDEACEPEFLRFALNVEDLRVKLLAAQKECGRLMQELQTSNAARSDLERKLHTARQMLDLERKKLRKSEAKTQSLENQMGMVRDLVWDGRNKLHEETCERLASVCSRASPAVSVGGKGNDQRESRGRGNGVRESEGLSTISEALDSTGLLLSELGYTRSEDELEWSLRHSKGWRKHRPSNPLEAPSGPKKPRSSFTTLQTEANGFTVESKECIVATTTVTVARDGPLRATSKIETNHPQEKVFPKTPVRTPLAPTQPQAAPVPSAPPKQMSTSESEESMICVKEPTGKLLYPSPSPFHSGINFARDKLNNRPHSFCQKTMVKAEVCEPCGKRIRFGKLASKCRDCRAVVHPECREKLPLPCVPASCTPTYKGQLGVIADFTPNVPPMIPGLILHCVNEIEARGLKEIGIYRISGSERDVKALKEEFLRGRGAPNLSSIDIHVICSVVKDFLRSLREPLVMPSMWADFVRCVEPPEEADQQARLYQVVSELPKPNRDTLSFIVLHLQRISECPECKMPDAISNLAKIFGPTIVGYSSAIPEPEQMLKETAQQVAVMTLLMKTPSSYWACRVNSTQENRTPEIRGINSRTPSASSIHWAGGIFSTPIGTFRSSICLAVCSFLSKSERAALAV